jgi:hypothetical protein
MKKEKIVDLDFDQKKYPRKYVADGRFSEYYSVSAQSEPRANDKTVDLTYAENYTIDKKISELQKIKNDLEKIFDGTGKHYIMLFEGRTYYESDTAPLSWQIVRQETDEEYSERVRSKIGAEAKQADYERQQYEALKKKFGDK